MEKNFRLFYEVDYSVDKPDPTVKRIDLDALVKNDAFLYFLSDDAQYQLARKLGACLYVARLGDGGAKIYINEEEKNIRAELCAVNFALREGELIGLSCLDWNAKNMQIINTENNLINICLVFPL